MPRVKFFLIATFFAACVGAFGAQTVVGEDNQIFTGLAPLPDDPYKLHSRPGAPYTIYLDFTGQIAVVNSPWNPGGSLNRDPYAGTAQNIKNIWRRVADAFAAFNVDVTTEPPVGGVIPAHKKNFQRCIIGGDPFSLTDLMPLLPAGTVESVGWWTGGNSYFGSAKTDLIDFYDEIPCFVFPAPPFVLTEMQVATAICHQLGHAMGLSHKGVVADVLGSEWLAGRSSKDGLFYFGHGTEDSVNSWGPIMGLPVYGQNRQSWVDGWYVVPKMETLVQLVPGGTITVYVWTDNSGNRTDEIAQIKTILGEAPAVAPVGEFIPGSSVGYPDSLSIAGGTFVTGGSQHSFTFMASPGPISIGVLTTPTVGAPGPVDTQVVSNLKVNLSLSDEHGRQLFSGITGTYPDQGATLNFTASKSGIYRLVITSVGSDGTSYGTGVDFPTPFSTSFANRIPVGNKGVNYDSYASLGRYSLLGSWTAPAYIGPTATIDPVPATVSFGSTVNFVGKARDANIGSSDKFTFVWDFGDPRSPPNAATTVDAKTSNVSHVFKSPGTYTVRLYATNNFGKTSLAATKVITVNGSAPNAINVGSIAGAWRKVNSVSKLSNATIYVVDQYGSVFNGAYVYVNISGTVGGKAVNNNVVAKSDSTGKAVVSSAQYPVGATGSLTFTVTSLLPPTTLKSYPKNASPLGGSVVVPIPPP